MAPPCGPSHPTASECHPGRPWVQLIRPCPLCQVRLGSSLGGPYLGVHLRRKDFIWGHREDVPSLDGAVRTIRSLMKTHQLDRVFVATDAVREGMHFLPPCEVLGAPGQATWGGDTEFSAAPSLPPSHPEELDGAGNAQPHPAVLSLWRSSPPLAEYEELKKLLPEMMRFEPTWEELELYKDGGVAIIDQWVCAHARCLVAEGASVALRRSSCLQELTGRASGGLCDHVEGWWWSHTGVWWQSMCTH